MENKIQIFEDRKVRTAWSTEEEEWYFSVVDIVAILTDSENPRKYWSVLKTRLKKEGSEVTTNCSQLKMLAPDGKMRTRDAMTTAGILRLVQSIPSPKAEPFKMWLAKVGSERLDEIADPEKAFERGAEYYRAKGYPDEWITQRMMSIKVRKELTDEWKNRGITQEKEYAILTDEMTRAWSGLSVREYKQEKGLKKESLRDNMTNIELILNMLAEATTTTLSQQTQPQGMDASVEVAIQGGRVAHTAREEYERTTGTKAVSARNTTDKPALAIDTKKDDDDE